MSTNDHKKDNFIVSRKGAGKAEALASSITRMQKAGYKFVVIDSKEFGKKV